MRLAPRLFASPPLAAAVGILGLAGLLAACDTPSSPKETVERAVEKAVTGAIGESGVDARLEDGKLTVTAGTRRYELSGAPGGGPVENAPLPPLMPLLPSGEGTLLGSVHGIDEEVVHLGSPLPLDRAAAAFATAAAGKGWRLTRELTDGQMYTGHFDRADGTLRLALYGYAEETGSRLTAVLEPAPPAPATAP